MTIVYSHDARLMRQCSPEEAITLVDTGMWTTASGVNVTYCDESNGKPTEVSRALITQESDPALLAQPRCLGSESGAREIGDRVVACQTNL